MWSTIKTLVSDYSTYLYALIGAAILVAACYGTYSYTDLKWQKKWDANEIAVQKATQKQTDENRAKEQEYQSEIDKISADGAAKLKQAQADQAAATASAAAANGRIEQLRQQVNSAIESSSRAANTVSPGVGSTAGQAVNLLADVLQKSIERNRQLAAFADESWQAGMTCQAGWDALVAAQNKSALSQK